MVAINFVFNGYRDLILPISEQDDNVRNAVLAASASHMALKRTEWKSIATDYRMAAIKGLKQRANIEYPDELISHSSLSTMVVLLVDEMVAVGSDFHILLRMLKSFVEAKGGPGADLLICKTPSLEHVKDFEDISLQDLDFLYSCLDSHPGFSEIIFNLADLILKAAAIYLARSRNLPDALIFDLVTQFLERASSFNAASPGGHILIWSFFIVGAECSSDQDREFVTSQLQILWECTGFGNILYAKDILKSLWGKSSSKSWTNVLLDEVKSLIM
ncbi:hypothetical protein N7462_010101 [Penicillium macrosclerotiorum]|uniref:uncharacterized protein n=1 Tax=Penicillium macrosclerotiorum TaxID=303699 RepID=UPI0025471375|nr:uncharacterized protein N7462_010101 [Penicillium macrosclerotiorum]KAJ5669031.1 hypothetical protein N7462_010101 [Penicillium macrosclerotiorum]